MKTFKKIKKEDLELFYKQNINLKNYLNKDDFDDKIFYKQFNSINENMLINKIIEIDDNEINKPIKNNLTNLLEKSKSGDQTEFNEETYEMQILKLETTLLIRESLLSFSTRWRINQAK